MTINLYVNTSDNRYLQKTLASVLNNVPCVFKEDTSLENPVVIISPDNFRHNANYVYIPELSRYYYITDKTFSKQRVMLHLKCDVLMSFKDSIKQCECVAIRSANQYNNYLDDNLMTRLAYSDIYLKKFPNSLDKNLSLILVVGGA